MSLRVRSNGADAPADPDRRLPDTPSVRQRIVFIDLARALAVVAMVQGHTIDALLAPAYRIGTAYDGWLFVRGLTSCTFLTLSGVAFSVTALRRWDEQRRVSSRWIRRVRRFVFFLALGYFLRFPMGRFAHLRYADAERWQSFFVVDILHLVALTLLALQALVWVSRSPRVFAIATALSSAAIILCSPLVWASDWIQHLPVVLASYLSPAWGSLFPAFPWAGFILLGASCGVVLDRWIRRDSIGHVGVALVAAGAVLIAAASVGRLAQLAPYGPIQQAVSPGFFLLRLGWVFAFLGAAAALSTIWQRLPPLVQALAEESLLIYAVHVAILYGSHWNHGIGTIVGPLGPREVIPWIVVLVAAMMLLAWGWNRLQHQRPRAAWVVRVAVIAGLVVPFLGP